MNLNFIRFFFILTINQIVYSQDEQKCQRGLLSTYGIPSLEYPEPIEILICPNIKTSCCPVAAQQNIYNNWIMQNEGQKLKDQLDNYLDIYRHFLDNLEAVHDQAESLLTKSQDIKYSNCKVMADKLTEFEVDIVATKLKQTLNEMYEFFRNSYKGFYCSLCDHDQQQFYDTQNNIVQMNQQFCRDILVHSLPSLLYFHSDFAPFMNLAIRFLSNCDSQGNYDKKIIPKSLTFTIDVETQSRIKKCKNFIASEKWFLYCQPICQNFHIGNFSQFFHPHIKKFETFSKFVNKKILQFEQKELPTAEEQQRVRILTSKNPKTIQTVEVTDEQVIDTINDFRQEKSQQVVFNPTLNGEVDINDFEVDFQKTGINFYEIGKAAIIDEIMLRKAIEMQTQSIGLDIATVEADEELEKEPEQNLEEQAINSEIPVDEKLPEETSEQPQRLLMNNTLLKTFSLLLFIVFINMKQLIQNSTILKSINSISLLFC